MGGQRPIGSKVNEEFLAKNGFVSRIHRKKLSRRPMPEDDAARANALKSEVRSRVEHVFAMQKDKMGLFIRTIGMPAKGDDADRHGKHRLQREEAASSSAVSPPHGSKPAPRCRPCGGPERDPHVPNFSATVAQLRTVSPDSASNRELIEVSSLSNGSFDIQLLPLEMVLASFDGSKIITFGCTSRLAHSSWSLRGKFS